MGLNNSCRPSPSPGCRPAFLGGSAVSASVHGGILPARPAATAAASSSNGRAIPSSPPCSSMLANISSERLVAQKNRVAGCTVYPAQLPHATRSRCGTAVATVPGSARIMPGPVLLHGACRGRRAGRQDGACRIASKMLYRAIRWIGIQEGWIWKTFTFQFPGGARVMSGPVLVHGARRGRRAGRQDGACSVAGGLSCRATDKIGIRMFQK